MDNTLAWLIIGSFLGGICFMMVDLFIKEDDKRLTLGKVE